MTENMQQIFMYLDTAAYAENPARRILFYYLQDSMYFFISASISGDKVESP